MRSGLEYLADAVCDAHVDDPEYGYRLLTATTLVL